MEQQQQQQMKEQMEMLSAYSYGLCWSYCTNFLVVITNVAGTHGYCDPVYINTGILTKESDVYSFGVVLFEVLCGRSCFMNVNDERRFLAKLALSCYKKGNLNDIIDIDLKKQMNSDSLNMFSEIAYLCLQDDPKQRPSMGWVVEKLEKALQLQVSSIFFERFSIYGS
uniref:Protein kinase domain-containing protein n=1 Tax=Lactuca sativa TaxID=4236 RepID=A0A9R1XUW2_LACSA|nr:hypothetical protein LSAT_V11C200070770 [Lactuca sativa]